MLLENICYDTIFDYNSIEIHPTKEIVIKSQLRKYYCQHNKLKYCCIKCGGSRLCIHGNYKQYCRNCGGTGLCCHGKYKQNCTICNGLGICCHNNIIRHCKECKDNAICLHGKNCFWCKECTEIRKLKIKSCKHGKIKKLCLDCFEERKNTAKIIEKNAIDKWQVEYVIKNQHFFNCNEWCFYLSNQDEIKKLRCFKCKQNDQNFVLNKKYCTRIEMDKDNDKYLDVLINILT